MKITLRADNEKHREIAKMFVGCKTQSGELLGFHKYYMNGRFATQHKSDFHTMYSDEITIDLSKVEMDLRLAIGTDIEFELPTKGKRSTSKVLGCHPDLSCFHFKNSDLGSVLSVIYIPKSAVQLSKEYLERIGVEIEEGEE